MKKAILICFIFLLYGFGQIAKASYDDGAGLDYVPPNQNLGIHTMTVPEALTLNGNFALKDQAGA
ncbi:MAG: hypothetical protein HOA17_00495, partial [Candidatus Melainabacteria bacterium]|nr:hypothetical protein [Candidatus Melainabacteria bacterium]